MVTYAVFLKGDADEGYLKKLSPFLGITDLGDTVSVPQYNAQLLVDKSRKRDWNMEQIA